MQISDPVSGSLTSDSGGIRLVREYLATGVTGPVEEREYRVLTHPRIPQKGTGHRFIPDIRVSDIDVQQEARENETWRVRVQYSGQSSADPGNQTVGIDGFAGRVTVSSGVFTERTRLDANGNLMRVTYVGPDITIPGIQGGIFVLEGVPAQTGPAYVATSSPLEAEVQRPFFRIGVEVQRSTHAFQEAKRLVGRVSNGQWSNEPDRSWLITDCNSEPNNEGGNTWFYEFAYRPDGWQFRGEVLVRGVYPDDASIGNGIELFDVYPTFNPATIDFHIA